MLKPMIIAACLALVTGCTVGESIVIDENFGNAVRQNIAAQTINPMSDPEDDSESMDGQMATGAMQRYRTGPATAADESLTIGR